MTIETPMIAGWTDLIGLTTPAGRGPLRLDGQYAAALIRGGPADLFAIRHGGADGAQARRHFVARLPAGTLMPSPPVAGAWQLVVVPLPDTEVGWLGEAAYRTVVGAADAAVTPDAAGEEVARALVSGLETGLQAIADALRTGQPPRDAPPLAPRSVGSLAAGGVLAGTSGLWWLRVVGGDVVRNDGDRGEPIGGGELLLLTARDWITATAPCTVESMSSGELLAAGQLWTAADRHVARLLRVVETRIGRADAEFLHTLRKRKQINAAVVADAARAAYGVVGATDRQAPPAEVAHLNTYQLAAAVLRALITEDQVRIVEPADRSQAPADQRAALHAVARASGLHVREVRLPGGWSRRDLGPMIGWRRTGDDGKEEAVALVHHRGGYRTLDPQTGATLPLDAAEIARFGEAATVVQVPLPLASTLGDVLRGGLRGGRRDLTGLVLTAAVVAGLGLAIPLMSGRVLGAVAGQGTGDGLLQSAALLVSSALVAALVGIAQNLRLLRVEGRVELGSQLAVWDRLMRLPAQFFSRTTSGELANAVLGITFVRESLSGVLAQGVLAGVTVVADLLLLAIIDIRVALSGFALLAATSVLAWVCGRAVMRRMHRALPAEHRAAARTNQLLGGITKVQIAAAEDRAYSWWSAANSTARAELQRVRRVQAVLAAAAGVLPIAGQLALFALLAGPLAGRLTIEDFFVVNVAFALLLGAALVLVTAGIEVVAAVPRLADLHEIIDAEPEKRPDRADPGEIRGEISLHNVTFAYHADQPPILDDVSFTVRPGEFVAVVGPSGCGKSTLLRLLLGFEEPRSGSVRYDGQDLWELDVQAVRRQCGVVLQDGTLFAGSLRENLCGAGSYPLDRVWEAVRMAGLEQDVQALPMGLGTMVPFGGGTLSVGQRQRVLIARALIHHPRVLFFDEATSALDNRTQEVVTSSTRQLAASRIIIAHRLSTVRDADTILVMDRGRIVQRGDYDMLMADRDGLFHRLASRQLLGGAPPSR
ncbi:ATP-binding cassette domain-containing protein [Actinoplanes regularis]|uniref:NHLM bacteriocin system ABC transporter, ATP-binding protein n=1 Tax=Actinoplanes regularis TaxID=52697 RepID=A0A239HED5_9ACTN|nr:ATP-binding cassette domain-containing protein [Actinoplanes regularis]GIE91023.1 NHLP family bacteriocin export ABC transporter permease/ATPase subunit [Actinoplanes regularis]SNS79779.1 NHLM bacteriocin system ABC transporter, ATP-binding protein [Actinoplanes regularis]